MIRLVNLDLNISYFIVANGMRRMREQSTYMDLTTNNIQSFLYYDKYMKRNWSNSNDVTPSLLKLFVLVINLKSEPMIT